MQAVSESGDRRVGSRDSCSLAVKRRGVEPSPWVGISPEGAGTGSARLVLANGVVFDRQRLPLHTLVFRVLPEVLACIHRGWGFRARPRPSERDSSEHSYWFGLKCPAIDGLELDLEWLLSSISPRSLLECSALVRCTV